MAEQRKMQVNTGLYFGIGGAIVVVMWLWYLLEVFTDLRIVSIMENREDGIPMVLPLVATVLAPIGSFVMWRRAVGIAENGVFLDAEVTNIGGVADMLCKICLKYEFEGKEYDKVTEVTESTADDLEVGASIEVVVDKRNPDRFLVDAKQFRKPAGPE